MQTRERAAAPRPRPPIDAPLPASSRLPTREALLLDYQLRLLNWQLVLLTLLALLRSGVLAWFAWHAGAPGMSTATGLSRFVLEPGAGLLAAMLGGSLVTDDPARELTMATPTGVARVVVWRGSLALATLLLGSAAYLGWSLLLGVRQTSRQSPPVLLAIWLAPVLAMGLLGSLGSLAAGNASLGMAVAAVPLGASLFFNPTLVQIPLARLFLLSYTYSGGQNAPDWWTNRLTLLAVALALTLLVSWALRHEGHRLRDGRQPEAMPEGSSRHGNRP